MVQRQNWSVVANNNNIYAFFLLKILYILFISFHGQIDVPVQSMPQALYKQQYKAAYDVLQKEASDFYQDGYPTNQENRKEVATSAEHSVSWRWPRQSCSGHDSGPGLSSSRFCELDMDICPITKNSKAAAGDRDRRKRVKGSPGTNKRWWKFLKAWTSRTKKSDLRKRWRSRKTMILYIKSYKKYTNAFI